MIARIIIENALIITAELFFISANFSQLQRLVKTRNRRGLSAVNQTLNGAGNLAWITYFTSRQLFVPVFTNLTMLGITLVVLGFTLSNKKQFVRGITAIAIIGPLTSVLILTYPIYSGWLGVVYNFVAATPWLIHILRTQKTSGISEKSLYLAIGAITCTLLYSLLITSAPLLMGAVIGILLNAVVLRYYYKYRRDDKHVAATPIIR